VLVGKCDRRYASSYLEIKDNHGMTPLLLACQQENKYAAYYLLRRPRINFDATDIEENTVTHFCVRNAWCFEVESLINMGADVNTRNTRGETPLDLALQRAHGRQSDICIDMLTQRNKLAEIRSGAVAMGLNDRLGSNSSIRLISDEVLHKIARLL
jgi:ankyrin repeat protein